MMLMVMGHTKDGKVSVMGRVEHLLYAKKVGYFDV